jgi:DNA-binding transcriptional ArsR family regulator
VSIDAMKWAWRVDCKSAAEKLVLMALADNADNDGYCWPGNARTSYRCQMSESSVRRHIVALERAGLIEKVKRRRRKDGTLSVWIYRLNLLHDPELSTAHPQPVVTDAQISDHICADFCAPVNAQEPSVEPSTNPHSNNVSDIVQEAEIVPEWELSFRAFWKQYPRKVNRQQAVKAWRKLTDADRDAATQILPDHVAYWAQSKTGIEYIPHGASWLNARRWEDELVSDYKPAGSLVDAMVKYALQANRQERHADRTSDSGTRSIGRGDDRLE